MRVVLMLFSILLMIGLVVLVYVGFSGDDVVFFVLLEWVGIIYSYLD